MPKAFRPSAAGGVADAYRDDTPSVEKSLAARPAVWRICRELKVSRSVAKLFLEVESLSEGERFDLLELLRQRYHLTLDSDQYKFDRPWDDPRNRFGPAQQRLLRFLDGKGLAHEEEVLKALWRMEWVAAKRDKNEQTHKKLRDRLRQLAHSVNDRFRALHYLWEITRPRVKGGWSHLELSVLRHKKKKL